MIDPTRLRELEERLEPWKIISSTPEVRILGYGEISTVLAIEGDERMAYKRMPLFSSAAQANAYAQSYRRYTELLREAGLELPEDQTAVVEIPNRPVVLYIAQRRVPPERFCNDLVQRLGAAACRRLLDMVVERISRIWSFNAGRRGIELAIDGQLSNWAHFEGERLVFVDTTTPMFRIDGREQLDPELFLLSAPAFLRWLLRLAFLEEVMSRYYDPRRVFMDLAANLYKEHREDLIPAALESINARLCGRPALSLEEVRKYYASDKMIWSVFLAFRRFDRWVKTRIAGRRYEFVLPGKIKR